jgi:hypothetical protein
VRFASGDLTTPLDRRQDLAAFAGEIAPQRAHDDPASGPIRRGGDRLDLREHFEGDA